MLFATMQEWEEMNPLVRAVNKPFKLHRAIEVISSKIFYILQLRIKLGKDASFGRTFLIDDFQTVLDILNDNPGKKHLLSIFVSASFSKKKHISVYEVRKIFRKKNKESVDLYVYECSDGRNVMNMEINKKRFSKKNLKLIYDSKSESF